MSNQPHTLAIDHGEWRVLFASSIARVTEFVNQSQALTPEHLKAMHDHLDRAKLIASAWCAASPPAQVGEPITPDSDVTGQQAQANGAAEPKKRGGWPKGRARKQPAQAVQ